MGRISVHTQYGSYGTDHLEWTILSILGAYYVRETSLGSSMMSSAVSKSPSSAADSAIADIVRAERRLQEGRINVGRLRETRTLNACAKVKRSF